MPRATGERDGWARRARRLAARALAALAALVLAAAAAVFALFEWQLLRSHATPLPRFAAQPRGGDTAEGRRLAILVGCFEGCHGPEGEGGTEAAEGIFTATAPPLGAVVPRDDDAELAGLVRFGVKRDGRTAPHLAARSAAVIYADDRVTAASRAPPTSGRRPW